ncbi:unnamed protein product [Prorocentrum cordatum]|uniref:Peptidase M16 N-terminal domain-containing protein n=1 Tax=Prorocentrum cordatum TaxID=2364126 RepID=A0ABN9U0M7_9DINO|nr:unnamed protein product [Polarella glacialis]
MAVQAGSLDDPAELPGLAHFCEHMLFLGTSRYPLPDDYRNFMSAHGGTHNAFTAGEVTVYFGEVPYEAASDALSRFSDFFRAPLFNSDYVQKEVHAIDNEHAKNVIWAGKAGVGRWDLKAWRRKNALPGPSALGPSAPRGLHAAFFDDRASRAAVVSAFVLECWISALRVSDNGDSVSLPVSRSLAVMSRRNPVVCFASYFLPRLSMHWWAAAPLTTTSFLLPPMHILSVGNCPSSKAEVSSFLSTTKMLGIKAHRSGSGFISSGVKSTRWDAWKRDIRTFS